VKIGYFGVNRYPESENDVNFFVSRLVVAQFRFLYDTQALNIPSEQHFQAHSAVCFATGMAILIFFWDLFIFCFIKK
jgi:hypothetical protein